MTDIQQGEDACQSDTAAEKELSPWPQSLTPLPLPSIPFSFFVSATHRLPRPLIQDLDGFICQADSKQRGSWREEEALDTLLLELAYKRIWEEN